VACALPAGERPTRSCATPASGSMAHYMSSGLLYQRR
jgi:hypothetical protein